MARPAPGYDVQLYVAASNSTVSATLIQEAPKFNLVYFVNITLKGAQKLYSQIEKVALALLTAAHRLRPFF